ncbi:hypothetical protein GCM10025760_18320 [Microbacterium yannicii]|uniref:Uncharacterized protein n=1 Tax=Microbacterium yannicii TaxID=671622 RepID=A0ABP9M8R3_9MICO
MLEGANDPGNCHRTSLRRRSDTELRRCTDSELRRGTDSELRRGTDSELRRGTDPELRRCSVAATPKRRTIADEASCGPPRMSL